MTNNTSRSAQLIAWRDRVLRTPKHLREFEEECGLRSVNEKINQALAEERRAEMAVQKIRLSTNAFHALIATAEYAKGVESRRSLLVAVSDLYTLLSA